MTSEVAVYALKYVIVREKTGNPGMIIKNGFTMLLSTYVQILNESNCVNLVNLLL